MFHYRYPLLMSTVESVIMNLSYVKPLYINYQVSDNCMYIHKITYLNMLYICQ